MSSVHSCDMFVSVALVEDEDGLGQAPPQLVFLLRFGMLRFGIISRRQDLSERLKEHLQKTVEVRTKSNCQLSIFFFPSAVVGSCCPDKVTNPRQVMNTVPIKENTVLTEVNTELVEANTLVTKENRALTRYSRPDRS